ERELTRADLGVELVLDLIHLRRARVRLGPEVARVAGAAAELETDEVILLVLRQRADLAVLPHLLPLELVRVGARRADRRRPAVATDRGADARLRHVRVENAGRAHGIGED